jgi:3-keto-disaccharide hydrolase
MKQARTLIFVASFLAAPLAGAAGKASEPDAKGAAKAGPPNTLTAADKAAGWRLLFDGKTTKGWRGFKSDAFPAGSRWAVQDGALVRTAGKRTGDIVTVDQFDNFDLKWEWKIASGGNSGLKYLVEEAMSKSADDGVGFEYQMLDDEKHPDAKKGKGGNRTAGSLYDLVPAAKDKVLHPPGEWNESRVVVDGNHVEHWLNGGKVLSYERGSPEIKKIIADSKFKDIPGFGDVVKGHLLLQDHGNETAVRNLKIRTPKGVKTAKK